MAYNPTKFGKLIAMREQTYNEVTTGNVATTHSVFVNPGTGALQAGAAVIECDVFMPPTTREIFERASTKGGYYEIPAVSGSQHGAEFQVSFPLHGVSSATPTDNLAEHPDAMILDALLGSSVRHGYGAAKVASSGSDVDTVKYDPPDTNYTVGGALAVATASDGNQVGYVKSQDPVANTLELACALDSAPTASQTIYGSNTCFLSTAATNSFSFFWQSLELKSGLILTGCVPTSGTITMGPKDSYPKMEVTFLVNGISTADALANLTDFDYSFPVIPVPTGANGSRFVFQSVSGAPAVTALDVEGVSINITQEVTPQLGHGAASGVRDVLVTNRNVEVSFSGILGAKNPFDTSPDGRPIVDIANTSRKGIQLQVGSSFGNIASFFMGAPTQYEVPSITDMGGVHGIAFTFRPGNYTGDTGSAAVTNSDFRIAFL